MASASAAGQPEAQPSTVTLGRLQACVDPISQTKLALVMPCHVQASPRAFARDLCDDFVRKRCEPVQHLSGALSRLTFLAPYRSAKMESFTFHFAEDEVSVFVGFLQRVLVDRVKWGSLG